MLIPLPLAGGDYSDESRIIAREETVNLYPEVIGTPGARAQVVLRTCPGLTLFSSPSDGAVRGLHEMGGVLYVVAGEQLYSVANDGTFTSLGVVPGGTRVVMADNFIPDTRRQLVIVTTERGYVYDTVDGFVEITDPDFTAVAVPTSVAFLSGYITVPTEDGFIWSAITDATDWSALDFATAESSPDRVITILAVYGDLWVFGQRTIEIFRVTGSETVFDRVQTIDKGCGSIYGAVTADNGVFWLDETGRIWRANGFQPTRISTHAQEQYFAGVDFSLTWAFSFIDRGHEFVCFTVPNGQTHIYDVATGLWSRRASDKIDRWRVNGHERCYGYNLFGDYLTGDIWKLDPSVVKEGDDRLTRRRVMGYLHNNGNPMQVTEVQVLADTGRAIQVGDPEQTDPVIELRYSDDGGNNWSTWKTRSLGSIGQYAKRISFYRLGMIGRKGRSAMRVFELRMTDPVRADLVSVMMQLEQ